MKSKALPVVVVLLLSFLIILESCSSGKRAFERGDYYDAVIKAVVRLRSNPTHKKSQESLRNAYPLAVSYFESEANNQIASNSNFKWKSALESYGKINDMYEQIRQSPGALKVINNPKNYYSELGNLRDKAADESYNAGITALMKGNRMDARRAFQHFTDANNFSPGYREVIEYLDKSKDEATLKVVIEQIPVPTRYNLSGGFFQDRVQEFLNSNYPDRGFIKFYTPQAVQALNLARVDQIMRIQFDDFSVGNTTLTEREQTVTKDSVVVGETKVAGKSVPVYNTVTAKLTTYRKEVVSRGLLSLIVVDAQTNAVLTTRKFPGEYSWVSTWARFNGDERALTKQQVDLCKSRETQPPASQDLFLEFTKPIYNQLTPAIRQFYQNY